MQIRQARPDDATVIAEVYVRSWQQAFSGVPQRYLDAMDPRGEETGWKAWCEETRSPAKDMPVIAEVGTFYAPPEAGVS